MAHIKKELQDEKVHETAMREFEAAKKQHEMDRAWLLADRTKLNSDKDAMSVHSKQIDQALSHLTKERGDLETQRNQMEQEKA